MKSCSGNKGNWSVIGLGGTQTHLMFFISNILVLSDLSPNPYTSLTVHVHHTHTYCHTTGKWQCELSILNRCSWYDDFQRNAPSIVFDYFNEQWHSIRDQWTLGAKCAAGNFLNNTSNRIENINAKLKSVISKYSSLELFDYKYI